MFLALDAHEQEIANAAEAFLSNVFPLRRLHARARDPQQLTAFADMGWFGITTPEALGGIGLSPVEEALFFHEMGRVAGPLEVLTQTLAVTVAQTQPELCGQLLRGEEAVALLVVNHPDKPVRFLGEANVKYALSLGPQQSSLYRLNGDQCQSVPCLDQSVAMYVSSNTGDSSALTLIESTSDQSIWRQAQIDVAAMMVGMAQAALDMIVEYAKDRQTFGRPIGAYQAVRHPCSDMAVRIEAARSQLYYAATAIKENHVDQAMHADAAWLLAQQAVMLNVDANIQLHGGIGVTDEHDAHLLLKRANLLSRVLGHSKQMQTNMLSTVDDSASSS